METVDIVQVYRSSSGTKKHFIEKLSILLNDMKETIIVGDFNLCSNTEANDIVIQYILGKGFKSLMMEPTQIMGRSIDHCYIKKNAEVTEIQRYSPYYSDHDCLLITL